MERVDLSTEKSNSKVPCPEARTSLVVSSHPGLLEPRQSDYCLFVKTLCNLYSVVNVQSTPALFVSHSETLFARGKEKFYPPWFVLSRLSFRFFSFSKLGLGFPTLFPEKLSEAFRRSSSGAMEEYTGSLAASQGWIFLFFLGQSAKISALRDSWRRRETMGSSRQ